MKNWQEIAEKFDKEFVQVGTRIKYVEVKNLVVVDVLKDFLHSTLDKYVRELIGQEEKFTPRQLEANPSNPGGDSTSWCESGGEQIETRNELRRELLAQHQKNLEEK